MINTITSLQNELVKEIAKLRNPKKRRETRRFLVEGMRACEPFFNSRFSLVHLLVTDAQRLWAESLPIDRRKIVLVTETIVKKLSAAVTPSGVIAVFDIPSSFYKEPTLGSGIVLANIQDPGNAGTLIRTATALGGHIVCVEGVDPFNEKVVQSSAGTLAHAKISQLSWTDLVTCAHKQNIALSALVVKNGANLVEQNDQKPRLLVVGNEGNGLPEAWIAECDEKITIPMPGQAESLNAAIAGSIGLYLLQMGKYFK